jgi:hypothetical protein
MPTAKILRNISGQDSFDFFDITQEFVIRRSGSDTGKSRRLVLASVYAFKLFGV